MITAQISASNISALQDEVFYVGEDGLDRKKRWNTQSHESGAPEAVVSGFHMPLVIFSNNFSKRQEIICSGLAKRTSKRRYHHTDPQP